MIPRCGKAGIHCPRELCLLTTLFLLWAPNLLLPASHYCPFLHCPLTAVQASIMAQNKTIVYHNGGLCLLTKKNILLISDTQSPLLRHQANSNQNQKANNSMKEHSHTAAITCTLIFPHWTSAIRLSHFLFSATDRTMHKDDRILLKAWMTCTRDRALTWIHSKASLKEFPFLIFQNCLGLLTQFWFFKLDKCTLCVSTYHSVILWRCHCGLEFCSRLGACGEAP